MKIHEASSFTLCSLAIVAACAFACSDNGGSPGGDGSAGHGSSGAGASSGGTSGNGGAAGTSSTGGIAGGGTGLGGSSGSDTAGFATGGGAGTANVVTRQRRVAVNDFNAACAIAEDRTVACWGAQGIIQPPSSADFDAVAARGSNFCGRRLDGSITCWGSFESAPTGQYADFSIGGDYGCALAQADGTVDCWQNTGGTIPEGAPSVAFAEIETAGSVACAHPADGPITCWGGTSELATPPDGAFRQVSLGLVHGCAIDLTGGTQCWGNTNGNTRVPPNGQPLLQVAAGPGATCGILMSKSIGCWAEEGSALSDMEGEFVEIAVGALHTCAIAADATVVCAPSIPNQPDDLKVVVE